jgi:hypothetical protein
MTKILGFKPMTLALVAGVGYLFYKKQADAKVAAATQAVATALQTAADAGAPAPVASNSDTMYQQTNINGIDGGMGLGESYGDFKRDVSHTFSSPGAAINAIINPIAQLQMINKIVPLKTALNPASLLTPLVKNLPIIQGVDPTKMLNNPLYALKTAAAMAINPVRLSKMGIEATARLVYSLKGSSSSASVPASEPPPATVVANFTGLNGNWTIGYNATTDVNWLIDWYPAAGNTTDPRAQDNTMARSDYTVDAIGSMLIGKSPSTLEATPAPEEQPTQFQVIGNGGTWILTKTTAGGDWSVSWVPTAGNTTPGDSQAATDTLPGGQSQSDLTAMLIGKSPSYFSGSGAPSTPAQTVTTTTPTTADQNVSYSDTVISLNPPTADQSAATTWASGTETGVQAQPTATSDQVMAPAAAPAAAPVQAQASGGGGMLALLAAGGAGLFFLLKRK